MNISILKSIYSRVLRGVVVGSSLLLLSCGGGSSTETSGIGGTGIVLGKITEFGSIYVNGSKFETDTSSFDIDGNPGGTQADLALGMVVELRVEVINGSLSSRAIEVIYDDEIQGPVDSTPVDVPGSGGSQRSFDIFGQTIIMDQTTTVFEMTGFSAIDTMDLLEISGFRNSANDIVASYIEKKDDFVPGVSEVELRGNISMFSATDFVIGGILIRYDSQTEIDVPAGMFGNDTFVEVEGILQADLSIQADEIEFEEENFPNNLMDLSLQGIIGNYNSISDFEVNGLRVDASQASLSPANAASLLENGLNVEVEGDIINGVLVADELEVRDGDAELESVVLSVDIANNRFEVFYPPLPGMVTVLSGSQTLFEDDSSAQLPVFSLNLLNIGDFVKVEGTAGAGQLEAAIVKRTDVDDSALQGPVDAFIEPTSITVLGITYNVDVGTSYEGFPDASSFFNALQIGDVIEIQDDVIADGIADEVEIED